MKNPPRSREQNVERQIRKWILANEATTAKPSDGKIITVSRQPGSRGQELAAILAQRLEYTLFDRELVLQIAESAKLSAAVIDTLDEKSHSFFEEWLQRAIDRRNFFMTDYLRHLSRIVRAIARPGNAVVVGRAANFILPQDRLFSIRTIAPFETRAKNYATDNSLTMADAKREILQIESSQRSFIRKHFHAAIGDPDHYHMVLNTGRLSMESATNSVLGTISK
jgi:cytidylate kinase